MIGMAIGLLVMLAVFSLLLNFTQASARVAQTQDVSAAMRASIGYAARRVAEAGFGIEDALVSLTVATGTGAVAGNSVSVRSRYVPEPLTPVAPGEIQTCILQIVPQAAAPSNLVETCAGVARTIAQGAVAFEVHSGCSTSAGTRVENYRRDTCQAGEILRTLRVALLMRATAPDPVPGRLVADDSYRLPVTVENTSGATYTVPVSAAGIAAGCEASGDCRAYKHRLLVSEVVPRNEMFRTGVPF